VCYEADESGQNFFPDVVSCQLQDAEDRINVPPLVGSEAFRGEGYLSSHAQLELVICDLEESQQFSDEDPDIGFVDQCVRQF